MAKTNLTRSNPHQTATENPNNSVVFVCAWALEEFIKACDDMIENLNSQSHALSAIHKLIDNTSEAAGVRGLVAVSRSFMMATCSSFADQLQSFKNDTGYTHVSSLLEGDFNEIFTCKSEKFKQLEESFDLAIENLVPLHSSLGSIIDALKPMPNTDKVINLLTLVSATLFKLLTDLFMFRGLWR